jgi:phospholipid/cholesterol/gamma-HCH transport system substrate-binding protein
MELIFKKREKIVGVFILVIGLLLLASVVVIGRGKDWFKTYVTYYTVFNESYNLQVDAPVKLSKADIGKVKEVKLHGDKVRVKLTILADYASRIRTDSVATVESPTFIGSEYVSIRPGSAQAKELKAGAEIPSKAKKSIDDILAEFKVEETAKKVLGAVQDLSDIAKKMNDPQGPLFTALKNVNGILRHVEEITRHINEGKGNVGELLKTEKLIKKVYVELDRIDKILANVQDGSQDVPQVTSSVKRGVNEIRDGVKRIDSVVKSVQQNPLIKPNLPPDPVGEKTDAGLRK